MPAKKTSNKTASKKSVSKKKPVLVSTVKNNSKSEAPKRPVFWLSLYWMMIALFVGTSCYVISNKNNVKITEAALTEEPIVREQPVNDEYAESGKQKIIAGDTVGALNDFTIAIERNPSSTNYIYRGEILMTGNNFEAALADFDSAIRVDNSSVIAYFDRALANIKLENLESAKSDLDNAVENYKGDQALSAHDLYAKRAQVNLWLRDWDGAESDYTYAISQNANDLDWDDFTGRAESRTNKGDFEGAIADYTSAVTIISDKIQKTQSETSRENMSRQAMVFFEKSGALRVKIGQMDLALQDLQAAHTLAIALDDMDNKNRLQILISSLSNR